MFSKPQRTALKRERAELIDSFQHLPPVENICIWTIPKMTTSFKLNVKQKKRLHFFHV